MKYLLATLVFISSQLFSHQYDLCICAIFQNESRFLREWIDFHLYQGVKHFYLYNNNSNDDYMQVLSDYCEQGIVTLIDWPKTYHTVDAWNEIQCDAYMDCVRRWKYRMKWCAFLDIDEFLFSPTGKSLPRILEEYEDCAGIAVNWVMYGTSGVKETESLLENLVWRAPMSYGANVHVKTICRPTLVSDCHNPHFFTYRLGHAVDENNNYQHGCFTKENSVEKLRINHYWLRDEKFLNEVKQKRRKAWGNAISQQEIDILNQEFDDSILRALH